MIGYHLTSLVNWKKIRKKGLIPYEISNTEIIWAVGEVFKGIWLWKRNPISKDLLFRLIYQFSTKKDFKIVLLKVCYAVTDIYELSYGRIMNIGGHSINLGEWVYEEKHGRVVILGKKVLSENIKLIKIFDLMRIVR